MENHDLENLISEFHLECPQCQKLFLIETRAILTSRPRFSCTGCHSQFWFPFPEGLHESDPVKGIRVPQESLNNAPHAASTIELHCPKCASPYRSGQAECHVCGVVFAKMDFVARRQSEPSATLHVQKLWEKVLTNYEDKATHQLFLQRAIKDGSLRFAAYKYGQLLAAHPNEEIATKMSEELQRQVAQELERKETAPLVVERRRFPFILMVYFICGALITMGWLVSEWRNLAGLGASLLFVTIALRMSFRPVS